MQVDLSDPGLGFSLEQFCPRQASFLIRTDDLEDQFYFQTDPESNLVGFGTELGASNAMTPNSV